MISGRDSNNLRVNSKISLGTGGGKEKDEGI